MRDSNPHVQSWWDLRDRPNVLLLHFTELKQDLRAAISRIAEFLGIAVPAANWPRILEHCSFDYMKRNASRLSPALDQSFEGGASTFIRAGVNGTWRDTLTAADIRKYEEHAARSLSADCAHWLATGMVADRAGTYGIGR